MQWIHSASSYLAISQLMFLACLFLVYFPKRLLARLIALVQCVPHSLHFGASAWL
jgi:hypothetical protein